MPKMRSRGGWVLSRQKGREEGYRLREENCRGAVVKWSMGSISY